MALSALLWLAGCAPIAPRPPLAVDETVQAAREAALAERSDWAFTGRLAINQGGYGGNARIQWRQDGELSDVQLSAPITRQSWRLRQSAGQATLEGIDGGIRTGPDAEALLLEVTGWSVPLASMRAWVRGARGSGAAQLSFDPQGLPATIIQHGWTVEYRGWLPGTPALPQKVFARRGGASVRLIVEEWTKP